MPERRCCNGSAFFYRFCTGLTMFAGSDHDDLLQRASDNTTGTYGRVHEASYHRLTTSLYYAAAVALPVIGSAQSHGLGIDHNANADLVALVQTGLFIGGYLG